MLFLLVTVMKFHTHTIHYYKITSCVRQYTLSDRLYERCAFTCKYVNTVVASPCFAGFALINQPQFRKQF